MKYTMVRLFLVAVSSCAVALAGNCASAGWGLLHGGGSSGGAAYGSYGAGYGSSGGGYGAGYGSSGGYGSYSGYGSSGGAGYGSSGGAAVAYGSSGGGSSGGNGPGPLRRLASSIHDHIHAKHARRAAYGSSGGSSGYASSYGSSGSYVSSYGSSGGYGAGYGSSGYSTSYGSSGGYGAGYGSSGYSTSYGSSGSSYGSTGGAYSGGYLGVSSQSPASTGMLASHADKGSEAIYLNVAVPAAAKVYVNDMPTTSSGVSRQFVSRGLVAGKSYKFDVRAEVVAADGTVAKESKSVTLTAGEREEIRFVSLADTRVQTVVTLNVPADAKVILAGNETNATGATRTYRTAQLKAGDQWDDYVVEVHHEGKIKRESLRLVAGDDISLTFNFSDDKSLVASR